MKLRDLAVIGARQRLLEIEQEANAIRATFSELRAARKPVRRRRVVRKAPRRRLSAAARKAVSVRMKKYWASRKKGG